MICLTPRTRIATQGGALPLDRLRAGQVLPTREAGAEPLRQLARRAICAQELAARPIFRPIRISCGALGPGLPDSDLIVTPRTRLLLSGRAAEGLVGQVEALVPAVDLLFLAGVDRPELDGVMALHPLFPRHRCVMVCGVWVECIQPEDWTVKGADCGPRDELLALMPELQQPRGIEAHLAALRQARQLDTAVS